VQWDLSAQNFTKEAMQKIEKLLSYQPNTRPDWFYNPKAFDGGPWWSAEGDFFESYDVARRSGVMLWKEPGFLGKQEFGFFLEGEQFFDFLFESLPVKDAFGRSTARGHVFSEGNIVQTIYAPVRFVPAPILLLYEDKNLYAYANLGTTASGKAWKLNLGPVDTGRIFCLQGIAPTVGDALLELRSEKEVRYVLLSAKGAP
jgi:hypothetical protein